MNFAFGTLLILFLLSPGYVFRYTFLKGPFSRKNFKPAASDEIFWSIIPAVIIQLTAFAVLQWSEQPVSVQQLYYLIIGSDKDGLDFQMIEAGIIPFTLYSVLLIIISGISGYSLRYLVTRFRLDKRFNIFKINNEWYYLFSGRILDNFDDDIEFIQIDILVRSESGNVIYCGILQDFFLTSDGGIDRLYLAKVDRRSFSKDVRPENAATKKSDNRYYNMPGDYFVIFGREILNLNVTYYKLKES